MEPLLDESVKSLDDEDEDISQFCIRNMQKASSLLTKGDEEQLFQELAKARKENDGKKIKELTKKVWQANIRLAIICARRFYYIVESHPEISLIDLVNAGELGIPRAIEKFDPSKGYKFSTYCCWWISQAIMRALNNGIVDIIRLPAHVHEKLNNLKKILDNAEGQEEKFLKQFDELESSVKNGLRARSVVSMNKRIDESGESSELGDILEDKNASPLENAEDDQLKDRIKKVLNELPDDEANILRLRFGLDGGGSMTLEQVGNRLNCTREWVRQLEERGLGRLRHPIRAYKLKGFLEE